MYPNPAADVITLESLTDTSTSSVIYIYNSLGQPVISQVLTIDETIFTLSVAHLPSGIYMWSKVEDGTVVHRGHFVINRP